MRTSLPDRCISSASVLTTPGLVVQSEVRVGFGDATASVTTTQSLDAVTGDLYVAAISTKPAGSVANVQGLGLTWQLLAVQCGGRSQTGVEVWTAQGTPNGAEPVTATLYSSSLSSTR